MQIIKTKKNDVIRKRCTPDIIHSIKYFNSDFFRKKKSECKYSKIYGKIT